MQNLVGTTDKLSLVTSAAATIDVIASFMDMTNGNPPVIQGSTSGNQPTAITTATTTDIVAAPGSGIIRNCKTLHIRNKHASLSCDVTVQLNRSGTLYELHKCTLAAGSSLEYVEGIGFFVLTNGPSAVLGKVLAADDAGGQNVATAQPWFPTAGSVGVSAATTYRMEGHLYLSRAAGAVSHTTGVLFGGTATLTSILWMAKVQVGDTMALLPMSRVVSIVATNTLVKAASTATTEQISIDLEGWVRVSAAGTFIPQFIYSAAPGGAPTTLKNSGFWLTPVGDNNFVSQGTWT